MGWFKDLFGRGKRRHVRGRPDTEEVRESGFTRVLRADPEPERRPRPTHDWDEPPSDPFPKSDRWAGADQPPAPEKPTVPSAMPAPPEPSRVQAPPRVPQPPPSDANQTILARIAVDRPLGRVVAVLVGVEGPLDGHVCRIFNGENVIGREGQPEALPNVPDTMTISRKHALLKAEEGYFAIEPLRPENATFVNEQLVDKPAVLEAGDRIRFGANKPSTFVLLVVP
ncbi:MAG TPA: FHA domain-containing protein [Myxococcota bacterium]|nr:FHA domain-containing protein [Myxococcota bacterium]